MNNKPIVPHAPISQIPRYVQYTSPVSSAGPVGDVGGATALPLNLIALIVAYLDDIGDIARVTRTSRLLYYMTLPQLYERVHLHSYPGIRYVNGRPEGFGGGSPFTMALNGLVTKPHAALVQDFRIWGQWKETGVEDFSKGRVPDNTMMLNILLRAATDRMAKLQSFSWELDCKPLKTLYQGLATHQTLTSLTLRFPSTRVPRPSVLIPPIPNLRMFKALDIDPLCYPDDVSLLILHSRKLEDLRLHFSPRMRQEAESILALETYFGRCLKAGYRLKVKHFAMQNFFGRNTHSFETMFLPDSCESIALIDTFGGPNSDPRNIFVDATWKMLPPDVSVNFRTVRSNEPSLEHVELMRRSTRSIENMYMVNAKKPFCPDGATSSPMTPDKSPEPVPEIAALKDEYIHTIVQYHGLSIRRLLLSDQWSLTPTDVGDLVRQCPNLEQLGLAINASSHQILPLLLPFLPKLKALRILKNDFLVEHTRTFTHELRMWQIGVDTAKFPDFGLAFIGIGDVTYKTGAVFEDTDADRNTFMRRQVSIADPSEFTNVEIWLLDNPDINVDPIMPFTP